MNKTNYHTHTARCFHAEGRDEEYVRAAIRAGFELLGFSDHGAVPFDGGYVSPMRMSMEEADGYIGSVRALADRYQGEIKIHCGMEYEYFPEHLALYSDLLSSGKLDYIILGNHFDLDERRGMYFAECTGPEHIRRYVDTALAGLQTGLFSCLAHPDLFLYGYPRFDAEARQASRDLCAGARSMGVPLEYNLLGLEKQAEGVPGLGYPHIAFWEIAAEEGCTAIIGVDAHRPEALLEYGYEEACAMLDSLGIRRVSTLSFQGHSGPGPFI